MMDDDKALDPGSSVQREMLCSEVSMVRVSYLRHLLCTLACDLFRSK